MSEAANKKLTMGFFSSFTPPAWHASSDRMFGDDWWSGGYYARLAQQAEKAAFDFMFFEDTAGVSRVGGSMENDLTYSISGPKNDPVALITYLAALTSKIGLISTASTSFYPPFMLARLYSTIDNLSKGRAGWNIVTSSENEAAQNFGYDELPGTQERYDRADEFMDVVNALWESWEDGAVVRDQARNVYTDASKVHEINHVGKHFKVRGPLNSLPSPQHKPIFAQAGGSGRGRDFAAKHAEIVMGISNGGIAHMKEYCDDVRGRMRSMGRDPKSCKILYMVKLYVCDDKTAFREGITDQQLNSVILTHAAHFGVDLTKFDLHKPLPMDTVANGTTSMVDLMKAEGQRGKTIRDVLIDINWGNPEVGQVGPAAEIAENLIDVMNEVGGDGYIINVCQDANAEHAAGIFEGVIPELQRRGAMRTEYAGETFRESLFSQ